jgi:adenine-specific DNA-methyltransferase
MRKPTKRPKQVRRTTTDTAAPSTDVSDSGPRTDRSASAVRDDTSDGEDSDEDHGHVTSASRASVVGPLPTAAPVSGSGPIRDVTELGAIFTKRWVAELVLDLAGYVPGNSLHSSTVLEPACGDGAFLEVIVNRLVEDCRLAGASLADAAGAVVAFDLDTATVAAARSKVTAILRRAGESEQSAHALAWHWVKQADFLKTAQTLTANARWVVGNPPYVRIEDVSRSDIADYRSRWPTMSGRADIYVGFFEAGLALLEPGGRLAYICADRWMRNRYGADLRQLVEEKFALETCIVMHAVDAFENRVAAYPAITVIAAHSQSDVLVVEAEPTFDETAAARLVKAHGRGPGPVVVDPDFRSSWLPTWSRGAKSWPAGAPEDLNRLARLEARLPTLETAGAYVSVGTATGADDIYVVDDPSLVEDHLAFPTLAARETALGGVAWRGRYLITPWTSAGLVELDEHPRLRRYLKANEARLRERHVAKRNPERWWRTIDRIDPATASTPKLLIPDLKDRIHPVYDQGKYVPLHSLYYVTSERWDLAVLGGILMSAQANLFVEAYSVRMANGYMRVSAQYLRRVRVPEPESISRPVADQLRAAFWSRDKDAATLAASAVYLA